MAEGLGCPARLSAPLDLLCSPLVSFPLFHPACPPLPPCALLVSLLFFIKCCVHPSAHPPRVQGTFEAGKFHGPGVLEWRDGGTLSLTFHDGRARTTGDTPVSIT